MKKTCHATLTLLFFSGLLFVFPRAVSAYTVVGSVAECDSCSDCTDAIQNSGQSEIRLTANIMNYSSGANYGTCIFQPSQMTGKTFDCDGHRIDGVDAGGAVHASAAIDTVARDNFTIKNCTITDFEIGLYLNDPESGAAHSSGYTVENNTISSCVTHGMFLDRADNITVRDNVVFNNNRGIVLENIKDSTLHDNFLHNNTQTGLGLTGQPSGEPAGYRDSQNNSIRDNTIEDNGIGVYFENTRAKNNSLDDNRICDNVVDVRNDGPTSEPNQGDNNFGDTVGGARGWYDTGESGAQHFTYGCSGVCFCGGSGNASTDCTDCHIKLSTSTCNTVLLVGDITNQDGNCINNPTMNNKVFDCQGFSIDGDGDAVGNGLGFTHTTNSNTRHDYTVQNCHLSDFAMGFRLDDGNTTSESANVTLRNNSVVNCTGGGINMDRHRNALVQGNTIRNTSPAIQATNVRNSTFTGNTINNTGGVYFVSESDTGGFDQASGNTITGNTITSSVNGLSFTNNGGTTQTRNNTVNNNTICHSSIADIHNDDLNNSGDNNTGDTAAGLELWRDTSATLPARFVNSCGPPPVDCVTGATSNIPTVNTSCGNGQPYCAGYSTNLLHMARQNYPSCGYHLGCISSYATAGLTCNYSASSNPAYACYRARLNNFDLGATIPGAYTMEALVCRDFAGTGQQHENVFMNINGDAGSVMVDPNTNGTPPPPGTGEDTCHWQNAGPTGGGGTFNLTSGATNTVIAQHAISSNSIDGGTSNSVGIAALRIKPGNCTSGAGSVTLTAFPNQITTMEGANNPTNVTTRLTWTTNNVHGCVASTLIGVTPVINEWIGNKNDAGGFEDVAPRSAGERTYNITCLDSANLFVSDSVLVDAQCSVSAGPWGGCFGTCGTGTQRQEIRAADCSTVYNTRECQLQPCGAGWEEKHF